MVKRGIIALGGYNNACTRFQHNDLEVEAGQSKEKKQKGPKRKGRRAMVKQEALNISKRESESIKRESCNPCKGNRLAILHIE